MYILYLSGRELEYPRNDVIVRALRRISTVEVVGWSGPGSLSWRSVSVLIRALPRLLTRRYDLVVVGFYGHLLMLPVGLISRAPILFDAFVSTYDTLVEDRQVYRSGSPVAKLARWLDRTATGLSDHVLLDTPLHCQYFQQHLGLPSAKLSDLPVGCNEAIFKPRADLNGDDTVVLYYSTYLPLHGATTVVQSAALLQSHAAIRFRLIGRGPEFGQAYQTALDVQLRNLEFIPMIPIQQLPAEIAGATICLGGHFGKTAKADRVVPGKVYQLLAMAKPVIAGDTAANRRLFSRDGCALLTPPGDPEALAAAILDLHGAPQKRQALSLAGRSLYEECCSEAVITENLAAIIRRMLE